MSDPEFIVVYRCSFCNDITRDAYATCLFDERSDSWIVVCKDCDEIPDAMGFSMYHVDGCPVGFFLADGLDYARVKKWLTHARFENLPSEVIQGFYEAFVFPAEFASRLEI